MASRTGRGQQPLIGSDLLERSAIGQSQAKEARVRCVQDSQAIPARLDLIKGLHPAIHDHGVADDLIHPGMLRIGRDGIEQLPLVIEDPVVEHQRQLKVAGRQMELLFVRIAKQIHAHQAGIQVEPAGTHGVVVVPKHGCILAVGVMAYTRFPAWVPMLGIAVIDCGRSAAMQMDDSARLRQLPAGAMEAVIDREEMPRRQVITPLDNEFFMTAGFEQGADSVWSITPQPSRRKITVHFYADLPHGDAEALVLQRQPLRKRQWIDKGLKLEGVDGAGGCEGCASWLIATTEPGARNERGERRLS